MAKNRNTFEKNRRELEKKRSAEEKRSRRKKKRELAKMPGAADDRSTSDEPERPME